MGQATVTLITEPRSTQPWLLEPMEVEYTKEPLEPHETAAECIEPKEPIESEPEKILNPMKLLIFNFQSRLALGIVCYLGLIV